MKRKLKEVEEAQDDVADEANLKKVKNDGEIG
jgi:hypothetical protein